MNGARLADYRAWHNLQVETKDIDPVYPVFSWLADHWNLSVPQRAWLCVCHVVYYHTGSTLTMFERVSDPDDLPDTVEGLRDAGLLSLPTTTERRGHRDPVQLSRHLLGLRSTLAADPWGWLGANGWGWEALNNRITEVPGNGRWASYKLAEMLQKVAGAPTAATDAGHRYSSGPRKGLALLYDDLPEGQKAADIAELDALTAGLAQWLGEPDVAQVETSLCDYNSLAHGRYYLGHDIDSMAEVLLSPRVVVPPEVWEAREAVFDDRLLGELRGWDGVRTNLKRAYRDRGVLDVTTDKAKA